MTVDFQTVQKKFAAHIRNPIKHSAPENIEARRLKIYSDLFYNNVEGFVARAFPVVKKIYGHENWHNLVRDFFESHTCESPFFSDISQEFLSYLQNERPTRPKKQEDPAFLIELAHYEWSELALEISQESIPNTGYNPDGKLLHSQIFLSPLCCLLHYQWPVHKIGPDFQPESSDNFYFLVMYKNRKDTIKFMELNAISARLLGIIQENPKLRGLQAITQLHTELVDQGINSFTLELLMEKGEESLNQLRELDIILGTRLESIN